MEYISSKGSKESEMAVRRGETEDKATIKVNAFHWGEKIEGIRQ